MVGEATYWVQYAIAGRILLAYPTGRLPGGAERRLVRVAYALAAIGSVARVAAQLRYGTDAYLEATAVLQFAWVVMGVLAAALIVVRLAQARPVRRESRFPAGAAALALAVFVAAFLFLATYGPPGVATTAVLFVAMAWTCVTAISVTFLVRLLREHLAPASVADLLYRLEHVPAADVEQTLAETVRDPGLRVVFPTPDGPVDVAGNRLDPATVAGLATTPLGDPPVALLMHDPDLAHRHQLLPAVADAARIALDNARLRAEVLAQLNEVRTSRRRLATAADQQRRELERDLHDGAQQRLLGIGCTLGVLRASLAEPAQRAVIEDVERQLRGTIAELRAIAHGLRPPILTDQGLEPTLAWLSRHAKVRVRLDVRVPERPAPIVEATAYDLVREALDRIGRTDGDARADVSVARDGDRLVIEVTGPGPVGADPGLIELTDQVAAVGGTLAADRARIRAELPWTS